MNEKLVCHIADLVRTKREAMQMSQGELAQLIGVTRQSICAYERRQFSPQISQMVKLARVLNIDLERLKEIE